MTNMQWRRQKYWACSLIAAINARIYLGGEDVSDDEFEELVDFTCGRIGACFQSKMPAAWRKLGLRVKNGSRNLKWIREHLPVEIAYFDPKYGFHAALIIGVDGKLLRLVNAWKSLVLWEELKFPSKVNRHFRSFRRA